MDYLTIEKVDFKNKAVFIRVDLNTTIKNKKPILTPRIKEHAFSIAELALKKAKVIVLAHQGRKGEKDFVSLNGHAKILSKELKKINSKLKVEFVNDVCGQKAIEKIKSLKQGEILLLENTRFLDSETNFEKTSELVDNLEPYCDVFVLDALSVAHRGHASVIGFKKPLKVAGRVLQKELEALEKFLSPKRPVVLILGGAKVLDSIKILKYWLKTNKADYVLVGGLFAIAFLNSLSYEIKTKSKLELDTEGITQLNQIYKKFKKIIYLPVDGVLNSSKPKIVDLKKTKKTDYEIFDIGPKTIKIYINLIKKAGSILINGPLGVYEKKGFEKGTKKVFLAVAKSKAFSLIGGGNSTDAIEKLKLKKEKFGYVSLSGKAFIEYLTEGTLIGLEYLKNK